MSQWDDVGTDWDEVGTNWDDDGGRANESGDRVNNRIAGIARNRRNRKSKNRLAAD